MLQPGFHSTGERAAKSEASPTDTDLLAEIQRLRAQLRQRESAHAALTISESRFRFLCNHSPLRMGIVELQDDTPDDLRVVWVNQAFLDLYKTTLAIIVGKSGAEMGSPAEDRKPWLEGYWRAWRTRQPVTVELFEKRHGAWIQATVAPLDEPASSVKRLAFVVTNITERKAAAESLRASEERFRLLFENSPDAIFVEDAQGRVRDVNPAACALHDTTRRDLVGKNVFDLVPAEYRDAVREDFRRLHAGEIHALVSTSLRSDGRVVPIELTCNPIAYGDEPCVLLHVRDISERVCAEQAQRNAQELETKLLEAQKLESLGILAGGIAHDFNNLLAIILGNASILDRSLPADSPLRTALDPIVRTSERATDLCKQMLAYSGRGKFIVEPVDFNAIIEDMLPLVQLSLSKKIAIQATLAPELPVIEADGTQLRQVLMNLVLNAGEAIGDALGAIHVSTAIGAPLANGQPTVVLEITDTGCGMDEATRGRIFDPFFSTKFTGRGLGLGTVQGIVRGHKGTIVVESEPGKGSRFRITLPGSAASLPDAMAAARGDREPAAPLGGRILVVDDEAEIRQLMTRMFAALGFQTVAAKDGEECLERLKDSPESFDLVFLDLTMPRLDGPETFRLLHLLRPELPVVLMSGYTEQEAAAKFVGKKVAGFITKPFTMQRLEAKIREVLHRPLK